MLPGAICRTCLTTNGTLYNLFGPDEAQLELGKYRVAEFVGLLTRSVVEEDDGLPAQICQPCYFEAQRAYMFKTKCDRSQAVLTQLKNVKIKIKKLKSDNSTDTSKKKPILLLNGFNQLNRLGQSDKTILTFNPVSNNVLIFGNPSSSQIFKTNEACSTNYVQLVNDSINLFDFENLVGTQVAANFMDVDQMEVKEDEMSNVSTLLMKDNTTSLANSVIVVGEMPAANDNLKTAHKADISGVPEEQNFECPVCPYVHISSEGLEKHMIKDHMAENICTICNKDIAGCEKEHFAQHIAAPIDYDEIIEGTTLIGGDYHCSMCPQSFKLRADIEKHISDAHNTFGDKFAVSEEKSEQIVGDSNMNKDDSFLFNDIIEESMDEDAFQTSSVPHTEEVVESVPEISTSLSASISTSINTSINTNINTNINTCSIEPKICTFDCSICSNSFETQEVLDQHIKNAHTALNKKGQTIYICGACIETFNNKELLEEHAKAHNDRPFKCVTCDMTFSYKHNLECHIRFKHCTACKGVWNKNCKSCNISEQEDRRYECNVCNKTFTNKSSWFRHKKTHFHEKPFKCELCSQSFNYKQILNLHVKEKHGKKEPNEDLKCKTCNEFFANKPELALHQKSHLNKARKCPYCPESFDLQSMLIFHISDHTDAPGFRCVVCSESFGSEDEFRNHIAEKHPDDPANKVVYECEECHQIYKNPEELREHVLLHRQKKPFECEICNQTFRYVQSLTRHTRTYHSTKPSLRPYPCQLCDKSFDDRAELVTHFRAHTSYLMLECEICSEKFPDKLRLGAHMVLKHDAKGIQNQDQHFKCEKCSKVFWNKVLYEIHVSTHNSEDPTVCKLCDEKFDTIEQMKEHLDKAHIEGVYQQLTQVGEQCEIGNNSSVLANNANVVCENNANANNFVFGDAFLNNEQMMNIHAPEAIMNEIFDDSSIEVA